MLHSRTKALKLLGMSFLISCFALMLFLFTPCQRVEAAETTIAKRLANLESRWGRFQLGGEFSLTADYKQRVYEEYRTPDLKNHLNIYLDSHIDQNFYFYLLLGHYDNYGYINHLYVDEAAVRYRSSNLLADLGKFKFTLDPLGLIADHQTSPIQGIALQTGNTDVYFGGYYSRLYLNTQGLNEEKLKITSDDQFGFRIALPKPGYMLGMTLVTTPTGDLSETAVGFDLIANAYGGTLQSEVVWYRPGKDNFQEYKHDGAFGSLVSWNKAVASQIYNLYAWYFAKGFAPVSSALNEIDKGEIYTLNSYGFGGAWQHNLNNNWTTTIKGGLLFSPEQTEFSRAQLVFSGRLCKSFSPATSLEFGFDSIFEPSVDKLELSRYNRLSLQFATAF